MHMSACDPKWTFPTPYSGLGRALTSNLHRDGPIRFALLEAIDLVETGSEKAGRGELAKTNP